MTQHEYVTLALQRCQMTSTCLTSSTTNVVGAQWLSGRVSDSRPKGCGFEPHRRHCVVSLSKNINASLVLVQPRKTRPFITERLLMGCKESNQTNKQTKQLMYIPHVMSGVEFLYQDEEFLYQNNSNSMFLSFFRRF